MAQPGFLFGPWNCRWSEVFFLSKHSLAMVNLKPLVPGHCLVISTRVVARFIDLSPDEVSDLWNTARVIGGTLEKQFNGQALTFAIQDGETAGQSVPHVHVHILPRRSGDFLKNDQIYDELEKSGVAPKHGVDNHDRKPRTKHEMAQEATMLRPFFDTSLPIPSDQSEQNTA